MLDDAKSAVSECVPVVRLLAVVLATPLVTVPVPIVVAPSLNVTVPVARDGVMVTVSVTVAPAVADPLGLAERAVVVVAAPPPPPLTRVDAQYSALALVCPLSISGPYCVSAVLPICVSGILRASE